MTFLSIILATFVISGLMIYARNQSAGGRKIEAHDDTTPRHPSLDMDLIHQRWREIMGMQSQGGVGLKNSLLEADKLLDYVMRGKGFAGDNMGDRLKLNGNRFSDLNGVWAAHKLRNQLAHEVDIDIVKPQIEDAVRKLKRGIEDLGVRLP